MSEKLDRQKLEEHRLIKAKEIEVRKEVTYMGDIAKKMLSRIEQLFDNPSERLLTKIRDYEKMLDNTDQEIHAFLLKLLGKNTLNSANIASLINISTYYENLGDNLKDLGKAIIKGNEKKTLFNETQKEDISLEEQFNQWDSSSIRMRKNYELLNDLIAKEDKK